MRSLTCVLVVACVAHKLCPCPSYSRRRDRINLGLWRSLYKGGGTGCIGYCTGHTRCVLCDILVVSCMMSVVSVGKFISLCLRLWHFLVFTKGHHVLSGRCMTNSPLGKLNLQL